MSAKITKSSVSTFFEVFGVICVCVGCLCFVTAVGAAERGHFVGILYGFAGLAALFGAALVFIGLLYIGLGEICDHISISANNSRIAAEELLEVNAKLTELIRIQKGDS